MIHTPDISKDFILNKAVRDATNLLLKPYMSAVLTESNTTPNICENKYEAINRLKEQWMSHSQDFLLRMATIAWDFLNILSMFQNDITRRLSEEDSPINDN